MNFDSVYQSVAGWGDGQDVTHLTPKQMASIPGFNRVSRELNFRRQMQVTECAKLWESFFKGRVKPFLMQEAMNPTEDYAFNALSKMAPHIFNEAMTRSDFLNLTTYVLDRMMWPNYAALPKTYDKVCKLHTNVKDFRTVERWQTDKGEAPFQVVGEMEGFNRSSVVTGKYSYKVKKYEKGDQISWEAVINDDMQMFQDLPVRLTTGGVRTIEQFYLQLIAGASGPNSSFYGTAISLVTGGTIKNVIDTSSYGGANNPPLTVQNLILATGLFMNLMTAEGRPIDVATDQLVVVVADGILFQTLQNIINTNQIVTQILGGKASSTAGGYPDLALQAKNWISGRIQPVYAPELRNIMTSNAGTSWWLFAKPGSGRPAIELGFLNGYDVPQLYRRLPDTVRVGGGTVEEMGDFETMATEFKGLLVLGGTRADPRMTMASNGTGS